MAASLEKSRQLTGWHVLGLFVGGFAIIIAVNVALAVNAVRTFPGLETDSAYIASQHFDADRAAQDALGWDVGAAVEASALRLAITGANGAAVRPEIVSATLGRATHVADDRVPAFAWDGAAWVAPVDLAPGNWNLRVDLRAPDGTPFRRRIPIHIGG
ncbi:FixH family protein [Jannaschia ovalis]|uniref:FixH family protein n=1 Tax=Jannaschia ovalis TaxID=3038773 RepID=A0ABY8L9Q1_9RHOB|nr:FixH family protein [Jannaschia sp. GRR-S6-38]WGH78072.1 FixH family protein [Jannaschia sp. GRR-S6-38]